MAVADGVIVGFGDISVDGYLDRLYVHEDYQRQGIATAICNELERHCTGKEVTVHASKTAKGFFERRGYRIIRENIVERNGTSIPNYLMEKPAM